MVHTEILALFQGLSKGKIWFSRPSWNKLPYYIVQQYRPKTYIQIQCMYTSYHCFRPETFFSISCSKSLSCLVLSFWINHFRLLSRHLWSMRWAGRYSYSTLLNSRTFQGLYQKFKCFSRIFKNQGLFKTTSKIQGLFKAMQTMYTVLNGTFPSFLQWTHPVP